MTPRGSRIDECVVSHRSARSKGSRPELGFRGLVSAGPRTLARNWNHADIRMQEVKHDQRSCRPGGVLGSYCYDLHWPALS